MRDQSWIGWGYDRCNQSFSRLLLLGLLCGAFEHNNFLFNWGTDLFDFWHFEFGLRVGRRHRDWDHRSELLRIWSILLYFLELDNFTICYSSWLFIRQTILRLLLRRLHHLSLCGSRWNQSGLLWLFFLAYWRITLDNFLYLGLLSWLLRLTSTLWSFNFSSHVYLPNDLGFLTLFLPRGEWRRPILLVPFLVKLHIVQNRLHHLWKAYTASWCHIIRKLCLFLEIRCFNCRHSGSRCFNNQVLLPLYTIMPCIIVPYLCPIRASLMVR